MPPSTSDLVDRLMRTAHQFRRAQFTALEPLGLTPAQERTLRMVARSAEPLRMGELAKRMGIVPRSVTSVIDALEAADLVKRTIDPANRRSILLTLTDHGRAVQDLLTDTRLEAGEKLFATLVPAERAELARLLDKISESTEGPANRG